MDRRIIVGVVVAVLVASICSLAQGNYENYVKIIGVNYTSPVEVGQPTNITVLVEYAPPCLITSPNSCMSTIMVVLSNGSLILGSLPVDTAPGILKFVFTVSLMQVGVNRLNISLYYLLNGTWVLVDEKAVNITVEPQLTTRIYTVTASNTTSVTPIFVNKTITVTETSTITKTITTVTTLVSTVSSTIYSTSYSTLLTTITSTTTINEANTVSYSQMELINVSLILSIISLILTAVALLVLTRYLVVRK
ncbi:hypothetical protein [Caldivirga maquilingensis]|uniref:Putative peptide transport system substrate-binding protein n=1 Tax=Caldivirga maquilingensis (strain ATCC 700844 / DSM 13496 / JCM 10307 / IC-167) TaxID=397948 RepID=A8MAI9_CALMQ|nr:hypothetical protein [Caldivirga maquilingensis]ABW02566.1 putative peptide transport system substrate-binding protein [Caldivirga maquilingensis IC-167]